MAPQRPRSSDPRDAALDQAAADWTATRIESYRAAHERGEPVPYDVRCVLDYEREANAEEEDFSPEADAEREASLRAQGVTFGPMRPSRAERDYFTPRRPRWPMRRPRPMPRARRPVCIARPHARRRREASTRSCARSGSSGDDSGGGDDPPHHHVVPTASVGPVGAVLAAAPVTPAERCAALCTAPEAVWERWWADLAELLREREGSAT